MQDLSPPGSEPTLSPQERHLLACARSGTWWRPADDTTPDDAPRDVVLRADILRCLIVGESWNGAPAPWPIHAKGLMVEGATIAGTLDFEGAAIAHTLRLHHCTFEQQILLTDCTAKTLSLRGSHLPQGLDARRAIFDGSLLLDRGFHAQGEVSLSEARIRGTLDCIAGCFENPGGRAIDANTAAIGETVQLRDGFVARGEINLVRARIGGNLRCERASFCNPDGDAIDLRLADIGAGFFLHNLRPAEGAARGLEGRLLLDQARCRTYCDDRRSWPAPGKLMLDGFAYERFQETDTRWRTRAEWLLLQSPEHLDRVFRPQPWTQAINVLRAMGYEHDARELAVRRELARARSRHTARLERFWLLALNIFVGNGYKPARALWWSALFVLLGWVVFAGAGSAGYMAPRDGNVRLSDAWNAAPPRTPALPRTYPPFNALVFALDAYLPVITFGQDESWEPSDVRSIPVLRAAPDRALLWLAGGGLPQSVYAGGWHRVVYWVEGGLGWVFVSLFIAGMSGIMKKE